MPDEHDQVFARDVFNASLTLMSILVVVITFLAVEYKDDRRYAPVGGSIYNAIVGTTVASVYAGALALVSLYKLRPVRGGTPLALAFGVLIAAMMAGILCFGISLVASPWG
jgi:predicted membrane protein